MDTISTKKLVQNENVQELAKTNNEKKLTKKRGGFSMLEFLIYLAIVGVAIAGIYVAYSKSQNNTNAKTMATDLQAISSGVKSSFAQDDNQFTDVGNETVCKLGILTSSLNYKKDCTGLTATTGVKNKFNGDVVVTGNTTTSSAFTITEKNVPNAVVTNVMNQMGVDGTIAIAVNSKCVYSSGAEGSAEAADCIQGTPQAYSATTLTTALDSGSTSGSSDITISYGM